MRATLLAALLALAATSGCGARDSLQVGEGGAPPDPGSGGADCDPGGIRLCGGPCPPAETLTDCPGQGCTAAAHSADLTPADMGVCWVQVPVCTHIERRSGLIRA